MLQTSLLGGLGALPTSKLLSVRSTTDANAAVTQSMQQRIMTICDPTFEWVWTGAKAMESVAGGGSWEGVWRKRAVGETCGDIRFMQKDMLALGPMLIPAEATSYAFQWEGLLPADWQAAIIETIGRDCDSCFRNNMKSTASGKVYGRLRRFLGDGIPAEVNQQFVSFDDIYRRGPGDYVNEVNIMTPEWVQANLSRINGAMSKPWRGTYEEFMRTGLWEADLIDAFVAQRPDAPIFLAKHPVNGKDYGVFMSVVRRDLSKAWDSTTNPHVLQFVWRPINKSWITKAWEWVKRLILKIVNFVKDTFCSLTDSQLATEAALKSGNVYAMAGGAGAQVLAPLVCKLKTQTCFDGSVIDIGATCPPPPDTKPKKWIPFVVGGVALAGVLAVLLAKPKPKKKPLPAGT